MYNLPIYKLRLVRIHLFLLSRQQHHQKAPLFHSSRFLISLLMYLVYTPAAAAQHLHLSHPLDVYKRQLEDVVRTLLLDVLLLPRALPEEGPRAATADPF